MLQQGVVPGSDPLIPSFPGRAAKATLTVFVMQGKLQWILQQGPEHAVGRRDKGGVQGERSGHVSASFALNTCSLKIKRKSQRSNAP